MFDLTSASVLIRPDLPAAFTRVWQRLAAAGTWWTGAERVAIAAAARAGYHDATAVPELDLPAPAIAAAVLLGGDPAAVTEAKIAQWERDGLDSNHYVELIGIVGQVTAVDTFHRALGMDLEPLPEPMIGEPSHTVPNPPARKTRAWVPMTGPPSIPISLSAVPAEMAALEDLHGPMYLSYAEMSDPELQRGLSRAQMELVAARTSAINECFY